MTEDTISEMMSAARELSNIRQALDKSTIIAITDQSGRIIHVNDKFCEISKFSREELIGQNHRIINSGYHPKEFFENIWKTISQGKYWEGEIKNRAKDGSYYWVHTTIAPFLNEKGKPYQYVSIRYEITSRKEAEEQLKVMVKQLERNNQELQANMIAIKEREAQILMQDRLASIGLLASGLAHEIGTPLGVMRGRAELVAGHANSDPLISKNMGVIIAQIDRVSKLIRSLLNLARGDQAKHEKEVRLSDAIGDVTDLLGHEFKKNEIALKIEVDSNLGLKISGEKESLHQVLLNLIVNSIHAIQNAVKSGRQSNHFIRICATEENDFVLISIQDTGCGISKENMKNLFKAFFTTKDIGSGTGLGLLTSYRIVRSWGGDMDVQSEEGFGTTFRIQLPCHH